MLCLFRTHSEYCVSTNFTEYSLEYTVAPVEMLDKALVEFCVGLNV